MTEFLQLRKRLMDNKGSFGRGSAVDSTLVIVDMQTLFPATQHATTMESVEMLIQQALSKRWGIVLLEHLGYGPTDERVLRALASQDGSLLGHCAIATKCIWDGSVQVATACQELELPIGKFFVCGVNTFECVQDTVIGLGLEFPGAQINLVQSACNCETKNSWSDFPERDNLRMIPTPCKIAS